MLAAKLVEAERTVALVLAFTLVAMPPIEDPRDVEAFDIFVLAVFTLVATPPSVAPSDDEAAFVLLLMAVWAAVIFPAVEAVPAVMLAANEDEAERTALLVLALMLAARLDEAEVTSDWRAKEPTERPAPVKVLEPNDQIWEAVRFELPVERARPIEPGVVRVEVATFQTSAARVPKVVSERVAADQTLVGMVEAREVEAVRTVASV